jgi:hypothetical protein
MFMTTACVDFDVVGDVDHGRLLQPGRDEPQRLIEQRLHDVRRFAAATLLCGASTTRRAPGVEVTVIVSAMLGRPNGQRRRLFA